MHYNDVLTIVDETIFTAKFEPSNAFFSLLQSVHYEENESCDVYYQFGTTRAAHRRNAMAATCKCIHGCQYVRRDIMVYIYTRITISSRTLLPTISNQIFLASEDPPVPSFFLRLANTQSYSRPLYASSVYIPHHCLVSHSTTT